MDPPSQSDAKLSAENQEEETRCITTRVAKIRFTGVIAADDDQQCYSSDEEVVEALSLCNNSPDTTLETRGVDVSDGEIGIRDNHFSSPEGVVGVSTLEALEEAVRKYKAIAKHVEPHTDQAKDIIRRLVQLRLKLFEAKEQQSAASAGDGLIHRDVKHVMGHVFEEHSWRDAKGYCEKCNGVIIAIVQTWRKCNGQEYTVSIFNQANLGFPSMACGYCCHSRCLNLINRMCASVKVSENTELLLSICAQKGLHSQNYRCAECRTRIGFQPGLREPRLCDYTGNYYCDYCHWNDTMVIPARILANWDFLPRKICRASKQYLRLMLRKPVLRIQDINTLLFRYLEELDEVKKLREQVIIMKEYFLQCSDALRSKLLVQLSERQHFVDNSDMYSLQDLIDLANDVLLPELTRIHASFALHIKTDCQHCRSKGYVCSLCEMRDVLFPFDSIAFVCPQCSTVVHRHCYLSHNHKCSECLRRKRQQQQEQ